MLDEEKNIDVGEADEQETTIDLDAPAVEPVEEEIQVEETSEEEVQAADTTEKPKDELGEYSEGVQKRIAKLTRKMREAERQKEEAIAYAQSVNQQAQQMRGQYDKLGGQYTNELEAKVETGMHAAKLAYKAAVENQDVDAQVNAQRAISQLSVEEARLRGLQQQQAIRAEQPVEQAVAQPQAQPQNNMPPLPVDEKAEDWASKNAWFGTDNAMTYTAFDIHKGLVEDEGYDPSTPEYYTEVDKRIRVAFPNKFAKVEESTTAPVQNVASARRPAANKGRRKTVKLTPSQVAISKRLGVPLEEYAKQLSLKEV
jgi:hypothetical protein